MLTWRNELWLIDHGASLYFHHSWTNWKEQSEKPFVQKKDHVLLRQATQLEKADHYFHSLLTSEKIKGIVDAVPESWLINNSESDTADQKREVYVDFLLNRINHSSIFVNEAMHARESFI
ncbi:MAG: hypothetical protein QM764_00165 [Chitinophagaceae bacterium]